MPLIIYLSSRSGYFLINRKPGPLILFSERESWTVNNNFLFILLQIKEKRKRKQSHFQSEHAEQVFFFGHQFLCNYLSQVKVEATLKIYFLTRTNRKKKYKNFFFYIRSLFVSVSRTTFNDIIIVTVTIDTIVLFSFTFYFNFDLGGVQMAISLSLRCHLQYSKLVSFCFVCFQLNLKSKIIISSMKQKKGKKLGFVA